MSEMSKREEEQRQIGNAFATSFMIEELETQIDAIERYELAPVFLNWLPREGKVLEAGSGSGRIAGWLLRKGFEVVGMDWSEELNQRARQLLPKAQFVTGDIRETPFEDHSFASILALGAVEHSLEGPLPALKEFYRILKPGGILINTVPYGGTLRRWSIRIRENNIIRRWAGKRYFKSQALQQAYSGSVAEWAPRLCYNAETPFFYEYSFNRQQIDAFVEATGFETLESWVGFKRDGLYHNFGPLACCYNKKSGHHPTLLGKLLMRLLPAEAYGHMLIHILKKS